MLRRLVLILSLMLAALGASREARAQPPGDPAAAVAKAQTGLTDLAHRMHQAQTEDQLDALRDQAQVLEVQAQLMVQGATPQLAALDARLAQLGPAPAHPAAEDPAVRQERDRLIRRRQGVDADVKQAKLIVVAASQLADRMGEQRRILFNEKLFRRGDSPLTAAFWSDLGANLPRDLSKLRAAVAGEAAAAREAASPKTFILIGLASVAALGLLFPIRIWLDVWGRRKAVGDEAQPRLKRSGLAIWLTFVGAATPGLAAGVVLTALQWSDALSPRGESLAQSAVRLVIWAAYVGALGGALLSVKRPGWRLAPMSDLTVARLRPYPWLAGLVTGAGLLLERINSAVGASLAATVATNDLLAVIFALTAGAILISAGRGRATAQAGLGEAGATAQRTSAWSLVAVAVVAAILASILGALAGYNAFAVFVARQIFWISVVAATLYLAMQFIDDVCTEVFQPSTRAGRTLHLVFALRASAIEQIGVLLSAILRLALLLTGLSLILSPFGDGAGPLFDRLRALGVGVRVGEVVISPTAVLEGVLAFGFGVVLVRAVQSWLNRRYLPKTEWDLGVQNSVSTAVGYIGVGLAAAWALASAGLGLERVALIASALSVGIGFGLQQIVQNFISGLIMLIERPVKVGDWVVVGALEGDVQRINVRATEIKMADLSTLLVPNSEFVTKPVQNKTLGSPLGRIQIQIGISPEGDAVAARDILLAAFEANPDVLAEPAPSVFIDAVTVSGIQFNAFAYVSGPRAVYGVRSALFLDILRHFRDAGIELARAQQDLRLNPGPGFDRLGAVTAPTPKPAEAQAPGRAKPQAGPAS